jgi:hypothetical protein
MNHHQQKTSHFLVLTLLMSALISLTGRQAIASNQFKSCQSTTVNDGGGDEGGKSGGGKR